MKTNEKVERFGIYGGSFSPIHTGHVRAARAFLDTMELDKLLIMPSAQSPHKITDPRASAEDRLTMCKLAFRDDADYLSGRLEVSDFEVKRGGKSYTVYTLEQFSAPGRRLYFLVGTDMFLTLSEWFRAEDIFSLADIVLIRRENDAVCTQRLKESQLEYEGLYGARIHEINEPPTVVSSTELRERIDVGIPLGELIPSMVEDYIIKNSLYGSCERNDNR